ncbi:MAG: FkbM family methyltransferase [Methylobacter sp.]|uniref:FkbM family methyltransferase n=1 Tax=Methylobacter sp. TaxID=2051955 RepID=UPI00272F4F5F|nr:FkbM family methyltransferase [Methylobacter sp.]MDP1663609.1 FkbM family methyltransferase [Methylobacter sp.]
MFRFLQHYAHAIDLRFSLICELERAVRSGKTIPKRIIPRVLKCPHSYDDKILLLRLLDPRENNLLIDVGGNTGYWCESFLEFFPNTRVVAFEPLRQEFEEYKQRFQKTDNVEVHNVGLSNKKEQVEIHVAERSAHSSLYDYVATQPALQVKVEGTQNAYLDTLDSFGLGTRPATRKFLKIDVQGHELSVLHGAVSTLPDIDVLLVECSFLAEYENISPSFAHVAGFLTDFDLYPVMFRNYGVSLGPHAWERDVIFCKKSLLNNIWSW